MLIGLGMREGDESVCVINISVTPGYLRVLPGVREYPSSEYPRTLRHSMHVSRKLLSPKCSKCFSDIDSGTEYWSYAGLVAGQFFWHYTHGRC